MGESVGILGHRDEAGSIARRIDISGRTLIARTFRWLIAAGGDVEQRDLMRWYSAHSTRLTASRSSFHNNFAPYARTRHDHQRQISGAVIEQYGDRRLRVKWIAPSPGMVVRALTVEALTRADQSLDWELGEAPEIAEPALAWLVLVRRELATRGSR